MKLDLDNILYIMMYMVFLLSVIGSIAYFCKKIYCKLKYILIKNIFLNRFIYSKELIPNQYVSFIKYDIWRYSSLF